MIRRKSSFVRAVALTAAGVITVAQGAREARAVVLAYEGFNYTAGSKLIDANNDGTYGDGLGAAGSGWDGPWDNAIPANPFVADGSNVVAGSLSYKDTLGNTLTTSGGKLINTGELGSAQPGRKLSFRRDGGTTGTTTWVSFLAIRTGLVNEAASGTNIGGTYARGANMSLFDSTMAVAPNEEHSTLVRIATACIRW